VVAYIDFVRIHTSTEFRFENAINFMEQPAKARQKADLDI
jgi:hypothetical protein